MSTALINRPKRWDRPLDPDMDDAGVEQALSVPPLAGIDPARFPKDLPLAGILRNDAALRRYKKGDILMRQGDYGSSAFIVLEGRVRVVVSPPLDPALYRGTGVAMRGRDQNTRTYLRDVDVIKAAHQTVAIGPGELFGEIAALGRTPRTASIFSDSPARLVEIRWQGLRDILRYARDLRAHIQQLYRERSLSVHLHDAPLFRHLPHDTIGRIAKETLFEQYGEFDWYARYKFAADRPFAERLAMEPLIAREGDYVDGLLMIRSGFARVTTRMNHGHRTLTCLGRGDLFGVEEIAHNFRSQTRIPLQYSLKAMGYVDVLRVPTAVVEEYILPALDPKELPALPLPVESDRDGAPLVTDPPSGGLDAAVMEFLVENRFINGTSAMLIDLDRCTRCDDCVRACAAVHGDEPRFIRDGKRLDRFMVAHACMHCIDPVCMIGCPTGAIHRAAQKGEVIINDTTCIGCTTCANACPYGNITMQEIRDAESGEPVRDRLTNTPILRATKCDLCIGRSVFPACRRNCPHDALVRMNMKSFNTISQWMNR